MYVLYFPVSKVVTSFLDYIFRSVQEVQHMFILKNPDLNTIFHS